MVTSSWPHLFLVGCSAGSRFPVSSRKRDGLNSQGSCQILGSWCRAQRFSITCKHHQNSLKDDSYSYLILNLFSKCSDICLLGYNKVFIHTIVFLGTEYPPILVSHMVKWGKFIGTWDIYRSISNMAASIWCISFLSSPVGRRLNPIWLSTSFLRMFCKSWWTAIIKANVERAIDEVNVPV